MKRFKIGSNRFGGIYQLQKKEADGRTYHLVEEADTLGDAIYRIEYSSFEGWHQTIGKNYRDIETALKAFDAVELFF